MPHHPGCVHFSRGRYILASGRSISVKHRLTPWNLQVLSFHSLLSSITETLRTGGLLLLIDFDPVSYTAPGVAYTPPVLSGGTSIPPPAAVKLLKAVNHACTSRGADILSVQHFKACYNINLPMWWQSDSCFSSRPSCTTKAISRTWSKQNTGCP